MISTTAIPNTHWETTTIDGRSERWVPVLDIAPGVVLGLSERGEWRVGGRASVPLRSGVQILSLLEHSPAEVLQRLRPRLAELHLPDAGATAVPFTLAIEAALRGGTDYWASLALAWLDVVPATEGLLDSLDVASEAPWTSQATKHGARRAWRELVARGSGDPDRS